MSTGSLDQRQSRVRRRFHAMNTGNCTTVFIFGLVAGIDRLPSRRYVQPPLHAAEKYQNGTDLVRAVVGCSEDWAAGWGMFRFAVRGLALGSVRRVRGGTPQSLCRVHWRNPCPRR